MSTVTWTIDTTDPLVSGHLVKGRPVVPMALWLNRSLQALEALAQNPGPELHQFLVREPLVLDGQTASRVQLSVTPTGAASGHLQVIRDGGRIDTDAQAVVVESLYGEPAEGGSSAPEVRGEGVPLDHQRFYDAAVIAGFSYGPGLRRIAAVQMDGASWAADLLPVDAAPNPWLAETTTLDALLQTGAILAADGGPTCWVPFRVDRVRCAGRGALSSVGRVAGLWRPTASTGPQKVADLIGFGPGEGAQPVALLGVHYRPLDEVRPRTAPRIHAAAPILATPAPHTVYDLLSQSLPEHRRMLLMRFIEDQLIEVLQWPSSRRGELQRGFEAIGMDSLMAVDLQFRLQTALRFALQPGEGFDAMSVEELADFLLERCLSFGDA